MDNDMKQKSVISMAKLANGRSRQCGKCKYHPCSESQADICYRAFNEGYLKGYKQAKKGLKDERL